MRKALLIAVSVLFVFFSQRVSGQTSQEQAYAKGREAVSLEDQGKYDEAIVLLLEAQKLDPSSALYPYELAYAYYAKEDYKKAAKYLEGLLSHPDVDDQVFQLLGNSYDNMGKEKKAFEIYDLGLIKFPRSGKLFLEKGNMYWKKKEYVTALDFYEKGIEAEPAFPSNYYRAARIYCASTEEVWGMMYGEIFMNLERSSGRTEEISKLLYNIYKSEIKFTSDTSYSVGFSQNATISLDDLKDTANLKMPFGIGVYEPVLMFSMLSEKEINMASLDRIRTNFVKMYFEKGYNTTYPNVLFDYQKKVLDAGYMDSYNHWILMKGDPDGFSDWYAMNKDKWDAFVKWFIDNPMVVDDDNRFFSGQY